MTRLGLPLLLAVVVVGLSICGSRLLVQDSSPSNATNAYSSDYRHSLPGGAPGYRAKQVEPTWDAEFRLELVGSRGELPDALSSRLVVDAELAIDALRSARTRDPLLTDRAAALPRDCDARRASRSRLVRGLGLHLRDAVEIPDHRGCLEEVLHSLDTFHAGRRVTVEPYD